MKNHNNKIFKIAGTLGCLIVVMVLFSINVFAADGSLNSSVLQQLQKKFPDGKYWDHLCTDVSITKSEKYNESVTEKACSHNEQVGSYDCNHFDGGGQCAGFARKLFYEYFGVYASKQPQSKNINDLKAGDIVRYHPAGYAHDHSIWITSVSGDKVTYADCNVTGPCKIRWNGTTTKSVIKQSLIHIKQAPLYGVTIDSDIPVLYVSQANTFLYSVSSNLSKSDVKWKAEPGSIVEINDKGDIKGKKAGTVTVTAYVTDQNGNVLCSDSKKVTVKNPTITLDKKSVTVYGNETVQLQATVNGPSQNVTWESSSTLNNKVTGNGTKATVSQGPTDVLKSTATTITATANGVSATCKVTRVPATFDFINKNISIDAGSSSLLSMIKKGAGTLNFSSSDKTILTVTATGGQIKGLKAGKVYVTAVSGKNKKQCTVTVKPAVKLNKTDLTLQKGKTFLLNSKVTGTKNKVKWSSSNKSVVSVSSKGKLTARKAGQATITATVKVGSLSGKASCKVKVTEPSIKLNKTSLSLKVGQTTALKATTKNTAGKISWKSSKSSVASVSSSGTITAKKAGTTTITAKINGKTAKCKVTVKKVTVSIKLSSSNLNLQKGKSATLKATVTGTTKKPVWKSSNIDIVTVSSSGAVSAKKAGTAIITAAVEGKKASCKIVVVDIVELKDYFGKLSGSFKKDKNKSRCIIAMYDNNNDKKTDAIVMSLNDWNNVKPEYSLYGVYPRMNKNEAHKLLTKNGWKNATLEECKKKMKNTSTNFEYYIWTKKLHFQYRPLGSRFYIKGNRIFAICYMTNEGYAIGLNNIYNIGCFEF